MKNKKKKKKRGKNATSTIFFITNFKWLVVTVVIGGEKKQFKWWVQIRTSINLTPRICCENVMNVGLPKKEKKKKYIQNFITFFTIELENFY